MRRALAAFFTALCLASPAVAQTSNPISQMPAATLPLSGSELVLLDQMTNGKYVTKTAPASALLGAIPNNTVTASMLASGAAAGNLGFTPARVVNVMAYGAVGDGVNDDTPAFAAAISAANAIASAGQSACLTIPRGIFYINGATLPSFSRNTAGGVCGAGSWKSVIKLGPNYAGDLFSWSDSWGANAFDASFSSVILPQKLGPRATGFTVISNAGYANQQNALMFYDHNDYVTVDDVDVEMLPGRALAFGITKYDTDAYLRESHISNFRAVASGKAGVPTIEFASQCGAPSPCGASDATDTIAISHVDVLAPIGPGFVISNAGPASGGVVRMIHILHLRVEGSTNGTGIATVSTDDLFKIGDASQAGPIQNITCVDCTFAVAPAGKSHIAINGSNAATAPSIISISGNIEGNSYASKGLTIGAGQRIYARFSNMYSTGTNVTVASSATTAGPIIIDGGGQEVGYTWAVDPSAAPYVGNGRNVWGVPGSTTQYVAPFPGQGDYVTGNARAQGSTDWQTGRYYYDQVASSPNATIAGGYANRASAGDATVCGGNNNVASGNRSTACGGYGNVASGDYSYAGGRQANTNNALGVEAWASGSFGVNGGDAQLLRGVMHAATSSTSATRLTADGSAANFVNVWNMFDNFAMTFDLTCTYRDTTNAKAQSWKWIGVLMNRGTGAASLSIAAPTATNGQNIGSPGATAPALSADTTNGGLNITFTAPNSDASHIVCGMSGVVSG